MICNVIHKKDTSWPCMYMWGSPFSLTFYLVPFQIFIFILLYHALLFLSIVVERPIWTYCNELVQYTENYAVYRCWNKHGKKVFTKVHFNFLHIKKLRPWIKHKNVLVYIIRFFVYLWFSNVYFKAPLRSVCVGTVNRFHYWMKAGVTLLPLLAVIYLGEIILLEDEL